MRKLSKITTDEGDFYLLLTLPDDPGVKELDVSLTDGKIVWNTHVSSDELSEMADYISMGRDEYFELTKKALTRKGLGPLQVVYEVKIHKEQAELAWKKITQDNVKFKLGVLSLAESASQSLESMLDFCVDQLSSYEEKIHSLSVDNEKELSDRDIWEKKLKRLVVAKEDNENRLFSKFVTILNSKKGKIRRLQDSVSKISDELVLLQNDERLLSQTQAPSRNAESARRQQSDGETTDEEECGSSMTLKATNPLQPDQLQISPSLMLNEVKKDRKDDTPCSSKKEKAKRYAVQGNQQCIKCSKNP